MFEASSYTQAMAMMYNHGGGIIGAAHNSLHDCSNRPYTPPYIIIASTTADDHKLMHMATTNSCTWPVSLWACECVRVMPVAVATLYPCAYAAGGV